MTTTSTSYATEALSEDLKGAVLRTRLIAFDFDGVFTNNTVYVLEDGREAVLCNRSDGIGLAKLQPLGVEAIITDFPARLLAARQAWVKTQRPVGG